MNPRKERKLDKDIIQAIESFDIGAVAALLKQGANPDAIISTRNREHDTVETKHLLHLALELQANDIIKLLLTHGANPYLANSDKETPIQVATRNCNVEALLSFDDSAVLSPAILGKALWFVLYKQPLDSYAGAKSLLQRGANPNIHLPSNTASPLELAIAHCPRETSKLLLCYGAKEENVSNLTKNKKKALNAYINEVKSSPTFEADKNEHEAMRKEKEEKAQAAEEVRIAQEKQRKETLEKKKKAKEEAKQLAEEQRQEAARLAKRQQYITAFEKIYTALRNGQPRLLRKTNFLLTLQHLSTDEKLDAITAQVERYPASRSSKAWELALTHDDVSADNIELFESIYKWSFSNSGLFKRSMLTGTTFFRSSNAFNQQLEDSHLFPDDIEAAAERNPKSRTANILNALR